MKAYILLEDGTVAEGVSRGAEKTVFGEICFNTGMTGYQEILTDPSYAGQTVVMTYPLIGNYGINPEAVESDGIKLRGFIIKELCEHESNHKSTENLEDYLKKNDIPCVSGVDTRMLTKRIRTKGAMNCVITTEEITDELKQRLAEFKFPADIVKQVSRKDAICHDKMIQSNKTVLKKIGLVDLGVKNGIIKHLTALCSEVHVFPHDVDAKTLLNSGFDAIMLSNGPGDPQDAKEAVKTTKELVGKIPLFGICLGCQILAIALGAETYKLKFGHRGSNHPVIDLRTNKVFMTAQNHGYAVSEENLPDTVQITHLNVNDNTVEGFSCPELNINTVQFHPEAGPGPLDANIIFEELLNLPNNPNR